jgi:hypothetical protein
LFELATDGSSKELSQLEEEFLPQEEENVLDYPLELVPVDSSMKIFLFLNLIILVFYFI